MLRDRDAGMQAVARALREDAIDESFDARVMDAIRREPRPARETGPAPARFRRAHAAWLLAATLVFAAVVGARWLTRPADEVVEFSLRAPAATRVAVVGDFNGWDRTHPRFQARRDRSGQWKLRARVRAGHHRYSFVVDDSLWVTDPRAPTVRDPDFGIPNSALVVAGREDRIVVDKSLEGLAKGASRERVIEVVQEFAEELAEARRALASAHPRAAVSDAELAAAVSALEAGLPATALMEIHQAAGERAGTMAFTIAAHLVSSGMEPSRVVTVVASELRAGAPDVALATLARSHRPNR